MDDVNRVGTEMSQDHIYIENTWIIYLGVEKGKVSASIKSRSDIQHYMLEDKKGPLKPLKKRKASILL